MCYFLIHNGGNKWSRKTCILFSFGIFWYIDKLTPLGKRHNSNMRLCIKLLNYGFT